MSSSSLGHVPEGKWQFDQAVTECFDDMLARSIPQYEVMREAVTNLVAHFAKPNSWVIDLGTSRGAALLAAANAIGAGSWYLGVDVSTPMLEAARETLSGWIKNGLAEVVHCDLRTQYPLRPASVVMSILTLQFTPIEYRQKIVQNVADNLLDGGAFIVVEKVLGEGSKVDDAMVKAYYGLKGSNGYTGEEIARKRVSLEGVLVPVTDAWNRELLRRAGFRYVDCFWRWMNFAGYVAVKN